jgi:hypothetical protein
MITSEVQRTLVKSPPELWAEISDPAALARQLGEFGEIRITRVEPEQRVEWRAGDTSGSVAIKPSGWGTKVKLTATRELADAAEDAQPRATPDGDAEPEADGASASGLHVGAAVAPQAVPHAHEPFLAAPPESLEHEPVDAGAALDDVDPTLEDGERTLDYESRTLDGGGQTPDDEQMRDDAERAPAIEPAGLAAAEGPRQDEIGERAASGERRGFFARLFARRRAPIADEGDAPAAQPPRQIAHERPAPKPYNALAVWAAQMEPDDEADERYAPDSAQTPSAGRPAGGDGAGEPAAPGALPAPLDDPAATETAPAHMPGDDGAPPLLHDGLQTRETPQLASGGSPAGACAAGVDAGTGGEQPGALTGESEARREAAEDEAVQQVTAVLTGVLDRLGAAHHRPFSRA